jgi:deoxyribonuclease (pyrimidine dimer)
MTRINLIPPVELMDQHLFAEFREIKMVPKSLARSIAARGVAGVLARIPPAFTLNTGHVSFFYDKGAYLVQRYAELRQELDRRGINYNRDSELDPDGTMLAPPWCGHYTPTPQALQIIRSRIAEKIAMKPEWYRYEGKSNAAQ